MMPRQFVVCESSQRWTVALRWALANGKIQVDTVSSLEACLERLEAKPLGVVAIEVSLLGIELMLRTIRDLREAFPSYALIALADGECEHVPLLYEVGAVHVAVSRRDLRSTVRLVGRCLSAAEQVPTSYRDEVWSRMPWADNAVT